MNKQKQRPQTQNIKNISKFIHKLYEILQNSQFDHIITWSSNGKSFIIKDTEELEKQVLPKFYRHNNISSFLRQLNMYNFLKRKKPGQKWKQYMHKYFVKNKEQQLKNIERKRQDKFSQKKSIKQKKLELKQRNKQNSQAKNKKDIYQLIIFNRNLFKQNGLLWEFFTKNSNILNFELDSTKTFHSTLEPQIDQISQNSNKIQGIIKEIRRIQEQERLRIQNNFQQILMQNEMIINEIEEIDNGILSGNFRYIQQRQ